MAIISIIVPCYNAQKYIEECALSILNQTIRDIEVIFVNDGSTDDTLNILNSLSDKDERVIVLNQKNQGPGRAVINGIIRSSSKYIGFVDSDDWVKDNMFDVLLNNLQKHDADMVQCGCLINATSLNNDLTCDKEYIYTDTKKEILKPFFEVKSTIYPLTNARWNKLYKKELLDKIVGNLNTDFLIGEDLTLNLKYLSICKKIVVLKGENNYYYRENTESISKKHTYKKQSSYLRMFEELKKIAVEFGYSHNAIDYDEKDGICSLMLDTLMSNFTLAEKERNIKYLYNILHSKKHIKEYAKKRPFAAKVLLFFIHLKMFKFVTLISLLKK